MKKAFVVLLLLACSCDSSDDDVKSGKLEIVFQYTENIRSMGKDLIATSGGYYLLIDEIGSPSGSSILKLDPSFKLIWKVTCEAVSISRIVELPNGRLIAAAQQSLLTINPDGTSWSELSSIRGQELSMLVASDILYVYGLDENYKPFISGYDHDLNFLWQHLTSGNRILQYVSGNELAAVNSLGDSVRNYNLNGTLSSQFPVQSGTKVFVTDMKVDNSGNRYILGLTKFADCCCNDKISILSVTETGQVNWQRSIGSSSANNISSKMLLDNSKVYISGAYGEDDTCVGGGFDSNPTDAYLAIYNLTGNIDKQYKYDSHVIGDGLNAILSHNGAVYVAGAGPGVDDQSSRATIFQLVD